MNWRKLFYGSGVMEDVVEAVISEEDGLIGDFVWFEVAKILAERGEEVELNTCGRIKMADIPITEEEYRFLSENPLEGMFRGIDLGELREKVARKLAEEEIDSLLGFEAFAAKKTFVVPVDRLERAVRYLMKQPLEGEYGYDYDREELFSILGIEV